MGHAENETHLDRIKRSAFNHPVIAVLIIAATSIVGAGQIAVAWDDLMVAIGRKPDALDLAAGTAKGEFSRRLTENGWRRLFWSNTYTGRVIRNAPSSDVDEAWRQYSFTVADWNAELVSMRHFLSEHHTPERREVFEGINNRFRRVHRFAVELRYDTLLSPTERARRARTIQSTNDTVNSQLCLLVSGVKKGNSWAQSFCSGPSGSEVEVDGSASQGARDDRVPAGPT